MTLAANLISANVRYGQIKEIEKVRGVKSVVIETRYEPMVLNQSMATDPNMSTSSSQIGSQAAWAAGYTGAGTKIAVIDTGIDLDHQSFSESGYLHAMEELAEDENQTLVEYETAKGVLTENGVASMLSQLNIGANAGMDAQKLYQSAKITMWTAISRLTTTATNRVSMAPTWPVSAPQTAIWKPLTVRLKMHWRRSGCRALHPTRS